MINHTVRLGLYNAMPAQTGHHHRPLVAWVDAVEPQGPQGLSILLLKWAPGPPRSVLFMLHSMRGKAIRLHR
jgi:hypothetical protein